MHRIAVIIVHAFFVQINAKEPVATNSVDTQDSPVDKLKDKLVDTLLSGALQTSPLHTTDLDDTVLEMAGHLAMPRKVAPLPPSSFFPIPSSGVPHAARAASPLHAEPTGGKDLKSNPLSIRPKLENKGKAEDLAKDGKASANIGFRFDEATGKWVRDDKSGDKISQWEGGAAQVKTVTLDGSSYVVWPAVFVSLLDRQMPQVTPKEALKMVQDEGAVLVDVEDEHKFNKHTMEGAINLPLFQPVQGDSMFDNLKRISVRLLSAKSATEQNPNFADRALELLPRDRPIIVACRRGGSIETTVKKEKAGGKIKEFEDPDKSFGIESRSLRAIFELYEAGFDKVYFLKGGMNEYGYQGLPMAAGVLSLAQTSPDVSMFTAALVGVSMASGVVFAMLRFRCRTSTAGEVPLLDA